METRTEIDFRHLAESPAFAEFSTIVYGLTGIRIALFSPDFARIRSRYSFDENYPLCKLIHSVEGGMDACLKCARRHFRKVVQARRGMSYICHAGLIDIAIPIFHKGRLIAIISCGQMRPEPGEERIQLVFDQTRHLNLSSDKVREAYLQTPYLDAQHLALTMQLITFFAEHLCEVGQQLLDAADCSSSNAVARAMQYVRENFCGDIPISTVAEHVNLRPNYLSTLFHKTTGIRYTEYVRRMRLDHAKSLLRQTSLEITEIASECGFNCIRHFNRVFHKLEHCTPRKYRAEMSRRDK